MNTRNLRRSNRPILNEQGYAKGILTKVISGVGEQAIKIGRETHKKEYNSYEFHFNIEGIVDVITMQMTTGNAINDIPKNKTKGKDKKQYNRITSACLSLELVTEKELPTLTDEKIAEIEQNLYKIKDLEVHLKIVQDKKTGYTNIDPSSIKTIKSDSKNS